MVGSGGRGGSTGKEPAGRRRNRRRRRRQRRGHRGWPRDRPSRRRPRRQRRAGGPRIRRAGVRGLLAAAGGRRRGCCAAGRIGAVGRWPCYPGRAVHVVRAVVPLPLYPAASARRRRSPLLDSRPWQHQQAAQLCSGLTAARSAVGGHRWARCCTREITMGAWGDVRFLETINRKTMGKTQHAKQSSYEYFFLKKGAALLLYF